VVAVLLLAPWPVAYAYDDGLGGGSPVAVAVAGPAAAPHWTARGMAIGGVEPGDLFYVDASAAPADITVTLHLTNADELASFYRYLHLQVGIYAAGDDGWVPADGAGGGPVPETYLTLRNGAVSFSLPGYASYRLAITGGCYYCFRSGAEDGNFSPKFYLTVE